MTTQGFVVTHAKEAKFERGLRSFFEYRDLGIKDATQGRVGAHVIRAASGTDFSSQPHLHSTTFQLVYILKGWIEFEYEGQGRVRSEALGQPFIRVDGFATADASPHGGIQCLHAERNPMRHPIRMPERKIHRMIPAEAASGNSQLR